MQKKISKHLPLIDRFIWQVEPMMDDRGCWEWTGAFNHSGYGLIRNEYTQYRAHRVSYELFIGPIGDLHVCHACDNRSCVNPTHLWLGTNKDNHLDRWAKGRGFVPMGEAVHTYKLSDEQILDICTSTKTYSEIAKQYGISRGYAYCLKTGRVRRSLIRAL